MSAVLWSYFYNTTLVEPPASSRILLNAAHPYTAATTAWVHQTTAAGLNVKATLLQIPSGAMLHIQDHQYSDRWVEFFTTGAVLDQGTYVEVPIAWDSNSALNLYNGPIVEVLFVTATDLTPTTEPTTPTGPHDYSPLIVAGPLVSLAEAKAHLRVTDTAHDVDIQQKLDAAEEAILAYETLAVDPTWDATTVPRRVKHAILLLVTHYYEARGEDLDRDEAVWAAIGRLLAFCRDPTLA